MLFKLLNRTKKTKVVITLAEHPNGSITSSIQLSGKANAALVLDAAQKIVNNLTVGIRDKVKKDKRFGGGAPGLSKFVNALTVGDVMPVKTLKYKSNE